MKTFALLTALVLSSLAFAQEKPAAPEGPVATPLSATPPPAAAPAPAPAPAVAVKPMASKPITADRKARRQEDARHCLEKATNPEVIKCAEEYL